MRNFLFFRLCSLILILGGNPLFASDYYYAGGRKIPINKETNLNGILVQRSQCEEVQNKISYEKKFHDEHYVLYVTKSSPLELNKLLGEDLYVELLPIYRNDSGSIMVPSKYIYVKTKNDSDSILLKKMADFEGIEIVGKDRFLPNWYTLALPPKSKVNVLTIANHLFETGLFASASPAFAGMNNDCSWDTYAFEMPYAYNMDYPGIDLDMCDAWSIATGQGITIAINDEGVYGAHPDLSSNIHQFSYDMESNSSPSVVYSPHGTCCAGIMAAERNNNYGSAGVACDAKIMSLSSITGGLNAQQKRADAMIIAANNGADVICNAWCCSQSDIISDAINLVVSEGRDGKGCVVVFSAGNNGSGNVNATVNGDSNVIVVGAIDSDGTLSWYSNFGSGLSVVALGGQYCQQ